MGYLGLEPRTYRLKAEYSTIELVTQQYFFTFAHATNTIFSKKKETIL